MFYDGDTFERNGLLFRVTFPYDDCSGAPWEECDGHGPVTDWTRRDKAPGELILCEDRGLKRFYNFQEACAIARRDGWSSKNCKPEMSRREKAATAARDNFEYLRRYCEGLWSYIGCIVTRLDEHGGDTDESESLWGIESDCYDYLESVVFELAETLSARHVADCDNAIENLRD